MLKTTQKFKNYLFINFLRDKKEAKNEEMCLLQL